MSPPVGPLGHCECFFAAVAKSSFPAASSVRIASSFSFAAARSTGCLGHTLLDGSVNSEICGSRAHRCPGVFVCSCGRRRNSAEVVVAAVDHEGGSGDVTAVGAGEVHHATADIGLGVAPMTEGDHRGYLVDCPTGGVVELGRPR